MVFRRPSIAFPATMLVVVLGALVWAGLSSPPAAAAPNWVRIEGPREMPIAKKLRYRIFCRDACTVDVTVRLVWPARPNIVNSLRGHLRPRERRANILILNGVSLNVLRANYRRARLRVLVRATNRTTGQRRVLRRSFGFAKRQRVNPAPA